MRQPNAASRLVAASRLRVASRLGALTRAGGPPKNTPGTIAAVVVAALVLALLTFVIGHETRHTTHPSATSIGVPGAVDIGFSQDMATHHDQAVLMANLAITRGGPAVRAIGDSILTVQSQEIGQLRGWLELWGKPIADPTPMAWMPGSADIDMTGMAVVPDGTSMPGMASPTQLVTLYRLSGTQFDVLFLQLMIRHHQGGIEMAHYAELHAKLSAVRNAATAMRVEEVQDIAVMQLLLKADGAKELPAP